MERYLLKIKKYFLFFFIILFVSFTVTSQSVSLLNNIRFDLWALVDAYPGLEDSNDYTGLEYPVKTVKEVAPFLINGMVYGWEFSYTPYDKKRGVQEYFEVKEIYPESYVEKSIKYSSPIIQDSKFTCWVDYKRSDYDIENYKYWASIKNPVVSGTGYGKLELGIEGIKVGAEDALKQAVRAHYRTVVKNKPKEIKGRVLIRDIPIIGVDSGRYVIKLDFFLEWGKIIEYKVF